tara:strand:- start:2469 stop:3173 length:705 start_codon:yes stop_codon:yes gene_type:complete
MALPRIDTPTYQLTLPSTQEKIDFRPFLVKEQKIIMMAQESNDERQMVKSLSELVTSCTFNKIDVNNLPIFDVEYMFLKIRGKSVGETVEINLVCPDDNKTQVRTKINLDDIQVQMTVGHSNIIDITDSIKLQLRYPIYSDSIDIGDVETTDGIFKLLCKCFFNLQYNDQTYNKVDITDNDIMEFIEQLTTEQFDKIVEFFNSMPKLRHVVDVTNPKTNVKSEVVLEGLQSFLG